MSDEYSEIAPEDIEQAKIEKARRFLREYEPPTIKIGEKQIDLKKLEPLTIGDWMEIERKAGLKRSELMSGQPRIEKMARVGHMMIMKIDSEITFQDFVNGCKQSALTHIWNVIAKLELDEPEENPT